MKRCPLCQTTFPDDANFCPMDAGRLVSVEASAPSPGVSQAGQTTLDAGMVGARFKLGPRVGGGRTGELFAAQDNTTGQDCVVKVVHPNVFPTPLIAQRTERELKQLHKITSDRVVRIIDFGHQGNATWVALEHVSGVPLSKLISERGRLSEDRARSIAIEVGEALAEAAKIGVIHRDVSPKNVLILEGDRVKVLNFSIPVPVTDKIFGVPEFLSPEQAEGKAVDQRSNIYSLGALIYYMVTGQPPFSGELSSVIQAHLHAAPVPLGQRVQGLELTTDLEKVVMKALEKASSRRHLTLRQMITEIEGSSGAAKSTTKPTPAPAPGQQTADAARTMFGYAAIGGQSNPGEAGPHSQAQPPMATAPASSPVAATPASPQGGAFAPMSYTPAAAVPPAAAPGPAASPAAAQPPAAGAKGKAKGQPEAPPTKKGQFRETMWFKKGELDEAAAQAAAMVQSSSPDALPVSDKADEMPIEDRYKDDGTISAKDRERLSLRTGHTQMMQAVKVSGQRGKVSEDELVSEMRSGRGKIFLIVVLVLAAVGGLTVWGITKGGDEEPKPAPATPATPASPTP
jgi:serine/threonine-protein kinase